ncbi:MAG: PilN domain-containing protein [Betaproteobacteria bacterium]
MATLDAAVTAGEQFRRFWRWWAGELHAIVPSSIVNLLSRMRVLPMVVAEDRGFAIYRFDGVTWQRLAKIIAATPEELGQKLGNELRRSRIERFAVGLQPGQYLAKTISVPLAAEDNLRTALRYELDRHTPFKPDDVGFDCCIVGRDDGSRELKVRLVTAPKSAISNAMSAVAGTGLLVAAVCPAFPDRAGLSINLLPHDESANGNLELVRRWAPWSALLLLAGAAILLPVYQKRAQVIELQPQVNVAAQQAQVSDALHQQLDRALGEYNFLLLKRYATPTSLQLLNEVTRILPDDTWVQSFELRATSKGREIQLQGETGVAGKMIELFEQSPLLTGASFKSPLTQAAGSQASRFHLAIDVRESAPPPVREAAQQPAVPSTAAAIPGEAAPGSPAAGTPGAADKVAQVVAPAPGAAGQPAAATPVVGAPAASSAGRGQPPTSNPSSASDAASRGSGTGPEKPTRMGPQTPSRVMPAPGNTNAFNPGPAPW